MKLKFLLVALAMLCIATTSAFACSTQGWYDCSSLGGDSDGDGVCNDWEDAYYGTDKWDADTDDGGTCDGEELWIYATNPTNGNDDIA